MLDMDKLSGFDWDEGNVGTFEARGFTAVDVERAFLNGRVYLSAVVVWEVAIKRALGKLDAPSDVRITLLGAGALPLPIDLEHAARVEALPLHHRDPFDRLLIAQAEVEDASVVTHDPAFLSYGVPVLW